MHSRLAYIPGPTEKVGRDQALLMKVKVLLLTLNHMLTSFSISGCLIRAGGRKYLRGWNKIQDNLRLFIVVRDQETNHILKNPKEPKQ